MILKESRHCSTSFCFLCQSRFEWTPWLHFCFPFTVKVFFSVSQPHCHYGHSILFLPLVNQTYCQVLISGFGELTTTPIWSKKYFGGGFFFPSPGDAICKLKRSELFENKKYSFLLWLIISVQHWLNLKGSALRGKHD